MEFSYGTKKWKSKGVYVTPKEEDESASGSTVEFALGLHAPGRFDKIMPIHNCLLQHDVSNQVRYCVLWPDLVLVCRKWKGLSPFLFIFHPHCKLLRCFIVRMSTPNALRCAIGYCLITFLKMIFKNKMSIIMIRNYPYSQNWKYLRSSLSNEFRSIYLLNSPRMYVLF